MFYWAKMFTTQIQAGHTYNKLKKCITINIVDKDADDPIIEWLQFLDAKSKEVMQMIEQKTQLPIEKISALRSVNNGRQ